MFGRRRPWGRKLLILSFLVAMIVGGGSAAAASAAPGPQLAMGDTFSMLIKPDGTLWAWGNNQYGQLGLGVYYSVRPAPVGSASDYWADVATGDYHVVAVKTDGTLWAWGRNTYGQLGLGTADADPHPTPTQVGTDADWASVATGLRFTFALKTDGSLWAWGQNTNGQLGLGDTTLRQAPVRVGMDTDWAMVDGGGQFAAAVKTNGTLWTWGLNDKYQLGQGDTTARYVPTQVGTDVDWASVACSDNDSRALKTTGSLWSWGYNNWGQLGLGDQATRNVPIQVGGTWGVTVVGDDSTLALMPNGTLRAWGDNTYGQIGQNDREFRAAPASVGSASDWAFVGSGHDHVGAVKSDGGLWVWGKNGAYQLGLGDTTDRLLPALAFFVDDYTAPTITSLTSSTHPESATYYASATPTFAWQTAADRSGVVMYSKDFDKSPGTVPAAVADSTAATWTAPVTADGTWYMHVRAGDAAGNWGPAVHRRVMIDATAPVTTDDAPATWSKTAVTVHLSATDVGTGVASTQYKLDGGAWTTGTQVTISTDGVHTLAYRSTDVAGGVEADKSATVRIDATAPVTTDDAPATWSRTAVTVHLSATDAGSGVASTQYKLDGGGWTTGTQVTISGDGVHTLAYHSTDNLGTVEADKSCTVRIDATAPATTDDAPTTWSKTAVTVHLTATGGGGVAKTEYKLDAGGWTTGTQVTIRGDGVHTLSYRSTDNLGRVEADKSCTVRIDTKRPATVAPRSASVRRGGFVSLKYRVNDARPGSPTGTVKIKIKTLSGKTVKQVTLSKRKVNTDLSYRFRCTLGKRVYKFYVLATDQAGNTQSKIGSNRLTVK